MSTLRRLFKPERDGARAALALAVIALVVFALARDSTQCARAAAGSCPVGNTETFASGVVINEDGNTTALNGTLRVEGDTEANLIYTDATNNRVGIGTSSPAQLVDVNGTLRSTAFQTGTIPSAPGHILKTADESVNSTTLQNDDHFFFTATANKTYAITAHFIVTGSDLDDIKWQFTVPSGDLFGSCSAGPTTGSLISAAGSNNQTIDFSLTYGMSCKASARLGVTGGTVQLQWAEVANAAGQATTISAGSWLTYLLLN